jgi:hypothetical protein
MANAHSDPPAPVLAFLVGRHYRAYTVEKGHFEFMVTRYDEKRVYGLVADPMESSIQLFPGDPISLVRDIHSFILLEERPPVELRRKGD